MTSSSIPEFTVPSTGDDNNATLETEVGSSIEAPYVSYLCNAKLGLDLEPQCLRVFVIIW